MGCRKMCWALLGLISAGSILGCQSNAGSGALIGGGAGAGLGAIIGHQSHGNTVGGALIGGAAGAIGGALIGNAMDDQQKQDRERSVNWRVADSGEEGYTRRSYSDDRLISRMDVVDWTRAGVRDDVIIDRIDRGSTTFHLVAADENWLRDQGVSDSVIRAMKDTTRR